MIFGLKDYFSEYCTTLGWPIIPTNFFCEETSPLPELDLVVYYKKGYAGLQKHIHL